MYINIARKYILLVEFLLIQPLFIRTSPLKYHTSKHIISLKISIFVLCAILGHLHEFVYHRFHKELIYQLAHLQYHYIINISNKFIKIVYTFVNFQFDVYAH